MRHNYSFILKETIHKLSHVAGLKYSINKLLSELYGIYQKKDDVLRDFLRLSKNKKSQHLRYQLKKKIMIISAPDDFIKIVESETEKVITYLYILLTVKIYESDLSLARQHLLFNIEYWKDIIEDL